MFSLSQLVSDLLQTSLELLTLGEGKKIAEKYIDSIRTIEDPVARNPAEKLLTLLSNTPLDATQLVEVVEILSHQKKILQTPFDQRVLGDLRIKIDAEKDIAVERGLEAQGKLPVELEALDAELFKRVGLVNFFEYYVAILLTYQKADPGIQKMMFESGVIKNLGFSAPGIVAGLQNDKGVTTFIYRIHDTQVRQQLTQVYYEVKKNILASEGDSKIVQAEIKNFLSAMLPLFLGHGITDFSELMPELYGLKKLEEVKNI